MAKTDEMLRVARQEQKSHNQNRIDSDYFLLLTQIGLLIFFIFDIFFSNSYEKPSSLILLLPILAVINMVFIRSGLSQGVIRPVSQFVYYAILFILLVFILPVFGIYLILLPYILFTSIYWYGFKGLFYGLCAIFTTIVIGGIYQFDQFNAQLLWLIARTTVLFAFGGIVLWRVLKTDFVERQKLGIVQKDSGVERDRMRALINSMDYAVIATNQKGIINLYNGAALSLLNTNKTLDSRSIKEIATLVDSDGQPVDLIEAASKSNGSLHRKDVLLRFDDDDKVNLEISVSAVRPSYGQRVGEGFVITLKDITKQHSLEEERDDFISVTSHELRTPIAIAEANLSTALLEKMSEGIQDKTKALLEAAHDNVIFLAGLVGDLATLSRAEQKSLDIELTKVDPSQIIKSLQNDYQEKADDKKLLLKVDIGDNLHSIISSQLYIKEILQNLMTNAIKYTDNGEITIGAKRDKDNSITFWVKDSGIGLSVSDQNKLFTKFFRSEDYHTRETGGTGLGLYITKKLAERIDGKISFDSKLGEGSTFYLSLPAVGGDKSQDQNKQTDAEVNEVATNL
ncbi:hypothetical protein KA529_00505 [Candidatus Saccharibacteria bacterium]|nr:hypothetical protein [Candidatus Saccharibacteria bacterium]